MKMYVWHEVLWDYSPGVMFALSENVEQARELILKDCSHVVREDLAKEPTIYDQPAGFAIWGGG